MTSTLRIAIGIGVTGLVGIGGGLGYWYRHLAARVPLIHLASVAAEAHRRREPRQATIDDVTRYVMGEWEPVPLTSTAPRQTGNGIQVDATCPDALLGQPVAIVVDRLEIAPDPGWHRIATLPMQRCPDVAGQAVVIPLAGSPIDPPLPLQVTARRSVEPSIASEWFDVPWGAQLRLVIGASVAGTPAQRSLPFAVVAENRAGRRVTLWQDALPLPTPAADVPWAPRTLSLDWAGLRLGPSMRVVFEASAIADDGGQALPFWGSPTIWAPATGPRPPAVRNVVLISIDTLRADRLSSYGYPLETTPVLDRFATEGTLFEQAIAPSNWTLPSHATMLTGLDPCVHQVGSSDGDRQVHPLPSGVRPLAEYLRGAGYATGAFTEDGYVNPTTFQRGFSVFRADTRHRLPSGGRMIDATLDAAIAWVREKADVPFFLFFHTYEVHEPYEPPVGYEGFAALRPLPLPPHGLPPSAEAAADAAAYVAEVAYTDHALARLFAILDTLGLRDRTIVVVTSDHGEAFGEHGVRRHGFSLYEEELHVPLIWRAPGLIASGRRVQQLVGLVDVVPTLLDLLGIERTTWTSGLSLRSALQVGTWTPPSSYRRLTIEGLTAERSLRGNGWKVIYRATRPELFDLLIDPTETAPRSAATATYATMHATLDGACAHGRAMIADASMPDTLPAPTHLPSDQREKLRALGYVE